MFVFEFSPFKYCIQDFFFMWHAVILLSRRFEGVVAQRKSPTMELLNDWGTTNSTVGDLVDILRSLKLFAAASLLLPGTFLRVYSMVKLKKL